MLRASGAGQDRVGPLDCCKCDLVHRRLELNCAEAAGKVSELALFLHSLEPLLKFQVWTVNELRPKGLRSLIGLNVMERHRVALHESPSVQLLAEDVHNLVRVFRGRFSVYHLPLGLLLALGLLLLQNLGEIGSHLFILLNQLTVLLLLLWLDFSGLFSFRFRLEGLLVEHVNLIFVISQGNHVLPFKMIALAPCALPLDVLDTEFGSPNRMIEVTSLVLAGFD